MTTNGLLLAQLYYLRSNFKRFFHNTLPQNRLEDNGYGCSGCDPPVFNLLSIAKATNKFSESKNRVSI